ncbi:FosA13 family fosfomycin resistance glutathione transferase [Morganella morganii]|uniref:FosA13 family fosfomycin resistance glutathione transferase n=1 Tax=Morganella morganii TaxID=582 RepID=UPI0005FB6E34|nr:VOC family protein [Morganella morganii]EKL3977152.1 VOC family protein [Morganella morganii]EKQ1114296.1 VOC family protein [Morganella morganii]ELA7676767.1 VOC family protein [Morganella morganii]ELB1013345.1 VOC family protein [Morganella morganii]KJY05500.1 Glutathione transferase FosA [Morganella morganii]
MLTGMNHLTLAVADLDRSLHFYRDILKMTLHTRWKYGAYLTCGELWICLSADPEIIHRPIHQGYTHYAFTLPPEQFPAFRSLLAAHQITLWKRNRSEGDSIYFLDPDGHQLEAHSGGIQQRLDACREAPYEEMIFPAPGQINV